MLLAIDCSSASLETVIRLSKILLQIIQMIVPIGLIVLGSIDLARGVFASDEGAIKKAQMTFFKRAIAAVLVFFTSMGVRVIMGIVGNDAWRECWDNISAKESDEMVCNYQIDLNV
ncbi:MAG TPA: hypothetical protein GXZ95_05215 [Mollicutes bacterium]|nr:hypothetical protein [Mollicutes bacterium]